MSENDSPQPAKNETAQFVSDTVMPAVNPFDTVVANTMEISTSEFVMQAAAQTLQQFDDQTLADTPQALTEITPAIKVEAENFVPQDPEPSTPNPTTVQEDSGEDTVTNAGFASEISSQNRTEKQAEQKPKAFAVATAVQPDTENPDTVVLPRKTVSGGSKKDTVSEVTDPTDTSGFNAFLLKEEILKAVSKTGYDTPTEIQAEIIPHVLAGRDVLAQSQTGTGKTAAFALPVLSRLDLDGPSPQVLVLAPTRELAMQVSQSFSTYGCELPRFSVATIYGGSDYSAQFRQLKRGAHVVVGTPGRIIDHIQRGSLDLSNIRCLVLDEADQMLNMGFLEDVQFVLEKTPTDRQVALFSATLPRPIRNVAERYLNDPARITIKAKTMTAESIRQRAVIVSPREKFDVLTSLLEAETTDGVIVFTKTKDSTVTVADQLNRNGFSAVALNGDMPQRVRERTIDQLKKGHLDILVATDVAARGLDVSRISHVFNYDMPHDNESYVHRIGRTGRAGRSGEAVIFLTRSQRYKLKGIEKTTRQSIEIIEPPTSADINEHRIKQFKQTIKDTIEQNDLTMFTQLIRDFEAESGKQMLSIAAALAHIGQNGRPFFKKDKPRRAPQAFSRDEDRGPREARRQRRDNRSAGGPPEQGMSRYRIAVGHKDGVRPGNIVGAIANEGGIDGKYIGPIRINETYTTIDLPADLPPDVLDTLRDTRVAGRALRLRLATDERPTRRKPRQSQFKPRSGGKPGRKKFVPRGKNHKKKKHS